MIRNYNRFCHQIGSFNREWFRLCIQKILLQCLVLFKKITFIWTYKWIFRNEQV